MSQTKPFLSLSITFLCAFLLFPGSGLFAMEGPPLKGITAHRGNSSEFPENTIPAFESAIAMGVDWAELDIHLTKDGKLVVIHDTNTARVGDKKLEVATSTYEELLTVDVATGFRKEQGKTLEEVPPQAIPLLEDVLAVFIKQDRTKVSLQPKTDCVIEAIQIIEKLEADHMVGFNDGNLGYMTQVKELAPQLPVFWDRPANSNIDEDIRIALEKGFEALVVNHNGLTAQKIGKIKAAGLEAGTWTVNKLEDMERLLSDGVERIYTDFPRLLKAIHPISGTIVSEGVYPGHLQGICVDDDAIYWSWTDVLVKTDMTGKVIRKLEVPSHHGDLCYHDGKIYVAVNLGKFNQPEGQADSWVYVYDAATLEELDRHPVQELVHGAGGMAFQEGRFIIVGGLPPGTDENYLYEYTPDFTFVRRHVLESGYTLMGIQTIAFDKGNWWFGCYGKPTVLLQADGDFQMVSKREFDASLGIVGLSDGRILIGTNTRIPGIGHVGRAVIYEKWK